MRNRIIVIVAILSGFAWLLPVFSPPGSMDLGSGGDLIGRILKVGCPILLGIVSFNRILTGILKKKTFGLVLLSFILIPVACTLMHPDVNYIMYVVLPISVSGIAMMGLLALSDNEIRLWLGGIGAVAVIFICAGLVKYGFEMPGYYGRPRLHIGFIHPTQTASALLSSIIFIIINMDRHFSSKKNIVLAPVLCFLVVLLYLSNSRNAFVSFTFFALGYFLFKLLKSSALKRLYVVWVMVMVVVIHIMAVILDLQSGLGFVADETSSGRLLIILELLQKIQETPVYTWLVGPSAVVIKKLDEAVFLGFAAIDSVYLSLLVNYGLIQLVSFVGLMLFVGLRLTRLSSAVYLAIWSAILVFFSLDAQGITASNLIIFSLLAVSIKGAVTATPALKANEANHVALPDRAKDLSPPVTIAPNTLMV